MPPILSLLPDWLTVPTGIAWFLTLGSMLLAAVGFVSSLESLWSYYVRRGVIMSRIGKILISRPFCIAVFLSGIAMLYCIHFGAPKWIWNRDLEVSILRYGFTDLLNSDELSADVQFTNNGSARRTVLSVIFTYQSPENSDTILFVSSMDNLFGSGKPLYVEPGQPVVATYKHKLEQDNKSLTKTPGVIFGLDITSIGKSGAPYFTNIEAMTITTAINGKTIGLLGGRQTNISLEHPSGYIPMKTYINRSGTKPP